MTEPTAAFSLKTLHANTTDFQVLIEHSADLVTFLDHQGRILYQSPSAVRHFGCDRRPQAGQHHSALDQLHPDDRARLVEQFRHSPPGVTLALSPYRVRHASGRWCWLEGSAIDLTNHLQGPGILVQSRDVTVRILAEMRSRALEGLSGALASAQTTAEVIQIILLEGLEAMGACAGGVLMLDEDQRQVNVVGSAGYPEHVERPWRQFRLDAHLPATTALREQRDLFLTLEDWCTLYPHLQHVSPPANGGSSVLTLRTQGKVTGAITLSFAEDRAFSETDRLYLRTVAAHCALALERGQLTAQLRRQERLYRKLAERSGDIASIVAPNGEVKYASPTVKRILGFSPQGRLGANVFDGVHPDDRDGVTRAFQKALRARHPVLVTSRFRHKTGHWVWLESTVTNAADDPDLQGVVVNSRDVTARIEAEEARRASERRLQLFGEQSDTLVRIFNPDGECLFVSQAAQTKLGYAAEDLLGCRIHDLIHPDDQAGVQAAWAAQGPLPSYRKRRRDGTYLWVDSTVRKVMDAAGTLVEVHVATQDITPRIEAEEALGLQLRRFQHLVDLTAEFAVQDDMQQHIQTALERCLELTPYTYSFFFPVNGDTLIGPLRAGQATDTMLPWTAPLEQIHRNGEIGRALRRHQAFFAGPDQAVFSPSEALPRPVWTSLAVLPVVARGVLRGVMAFGTNTPVEVDRDTRRLLLGVSEQAGRAVERSAHLDELKQSREETLRALGLALEYRDYETKGHTDRVLRLTERLGQALGFCGADLDALRWGAFLHDTGKVAIPDAILLKPGKLDPLEWDVIKRHPSIGYEMLHHIPSLPPTTLEVVLYHQERWNGSGYPKGLAGADIPLAARVFAVVDVYDALTSERPYKHAWTHAQAAEQLRKEAGVLLDARVVETFLQVLAQTPLAEASPYDPL